MPVEIKELIIKAIVSDDTEGSKSNTSMSDRQKEEIIETCVEQVLDILKDRNER
jgi:hypothetical protein